MVSFLITIIHYHIYSCHSLSLFWNRNCTFSGDIFQTMEDIQLVVNGSLSASTLSSNSDYGHYAQ